MKCFYHTDMDGKCAGAIVYKFYKLDRDYTKEVGEQCEFIPINYNDDFPFDKIIPNETIIIVDFSLQKEGEFDRLLKITDKVIWIDHHKTAIEKHKHLENNVIGLRQDGVAGCVLTWQYFYPKEEIPRIVERVM
jgi:oligoribonuclease NrnB/cAMP/cGMP phosphodiesterase (DHH superfamily)